MHRIAIAAVVLALAVAPTAFADETAPAAANSGMHVKAHSVIHHRNRNSSAAPLAADERSLTDAREQRQTRAMNLIGAAGYNDFSDLAADGNDYRATATKGGQHIPVRVDPDGGHVTPQQ